MRNLLWFFLFLIAAGIAHSQELQSSQICASCHNAIYKEWQTSRHAASTSASNPFYAAMRKWAISVGDEKTAQKCNRCHMPFSALNATEETVLRLQNEGVACDVCHATKKSGAWLEIGETNVKYGPLDDAVSAVHKSEYSAFHTSSSQCLTCHANLENEHGILSCATEIEYKQSSFYKDGVTCQDCHMPSVKSKVAELGKIRRVSAHNFYGGYNAEMLKNCASITLAAKGDTSLLTISAKIKNRTVGHALPTGSPLRVVYLKLQALDVNGAVVWQNFKRNPIKEDPQSVFMKLLEDESGKAPVPPWEAAEVKFDQRLLPGEERPLEYELVESHAARILAELYYRLAPPALIKKLNLEEDVYSTPVLIASESFTIQ